MKYRIILTLLWAAMFLISCEKKLPKDCYTKEYHKEHKNDICTQDCPGVTGCDGKFYCNECIMHTHGIRKTK